jgi:hypothetical protein
MLKRWHKNKWIIIGAVLVLAVAAVLVEVGRELGNHDSGHTPKSNHKVNTVGKISDVKNATFDYLEPADQSDWDFDDKSVIFEQENGIISYHINLKKAGTTVVVSEQQMPDDLKPQSSTKFTQFILSSNVSRSQDAGIGKVYFQPALSNGAPTEGSTTVIFATDDILMFGRAGKVLDYETWTMLMGAMRMVSPKK